MPGFIALIAGLLVSALPTLAQAEICREYTRTIIIGGKPQEGIGIACRQPDGSWRIQPESGGFTEVFEPEERIVVIEREVPVYVDKPYSYWEFSFGDFDRWGHRHHRHDGHHGKRKHRGHGRDHHGRR